MASIAPFPYLEPRQFVSPIRAYNLLSRYGLAVPDPCPEPRMMYYTDSAISHFNQQIRLHPREPIYFCLTGQSLIGIENITIDESAKSYLSTITTILRKEHEPCYKLVETNFFSPHTTWAEYEQFDKLDWQALNFHMAVEVALLLLLHQNHRDFRTLGPIINDNGDRLLLALWKRHVIIRLARESEFLGGGLRLPICASRVPALVGQYPGWKHELLTAAG